MTKYGNKTKGLLWLRDKSDLRFLRGKVLVPRFISLGVVSPKNEAGIAERRRRALNWAARWSSAAGGLFSVRSGASVSLPGLMDTFLNASLDEVPDLVTEVYKSFEKPSVQEEIRGMESPPLGTDCIVQIMIQPARNMKFGVIFTASEEGFPDPRMMWSDQPGDVVGSEDANLETNLPRCVSTLAQMWKSEKGVPPEFEVATDGSTIWFLQVRDQKLTQREKAAMAGDKLGVPGDTKVLLAARGGGICTITDPSQYCIIEESSPEQISKAREKDLLLWRKGSIFSHLAVLCRTSEIAYGNIGEQDVPETPFTFFDGTFYEECEITREEITKKIDLDVNWDILDFFYGDDKKISFRSGGRLGRHFTDTFLRYKRYLMLGERKESVVEFAQNLIAVSFVACYGELRHHEDSPIDIYYKVSRSDAWVKALAGEFQPPWEWLAAGADAFDNLDWSDSIGGPKWASIARRTLELAELLKKVKEDPSRKNFLDLERMVSIVENEEHNNAIFWTKVTYSSGEVRLALDIFNQVDTWEHFKTRVQEIIVDPDDFGWFTQDLPPRKISWPIGKADPEEIWLYGERKMPPLPEDSTIANQRIHFAHEGDTVLASIEGHWGTVDISVPDCLEDADELFYLLVSQLSDNVDKLAYPGLRNLMSFVIKGVMIHVIGLRSYTVAHSKSISSFTDKYSRMISEQIEDMIERLEQESAKAIEEDMETFSAMDWPEPEKEEEEEDGVRAGSDWDW